jgi:hypothetical protein
MWNLWSPNWSLLTTCVFLYQSFVLITVTFLRSGAVIAQSVYRWATGRTIGVLGFDSQRGLGIFLFTTASRTALGPTQPPFQWEPGALSLGVKWLGREADHSPPSSAEVKEWVELYFHTPSTPSWRCGYFKHRDNFTFTVTFLQSGSVGPFRAAVQAESQPTLIKGTGHQNVSA